MEESATAATEDAEHPLRGEIALCLSGGGYRAAAFHLGVLEALDELGLRERVQVLSALSGGAIVSACYVGALARGASFEEFRRDFRRSLLSHNPLAGAFDALPHSGDERRQPSLIRSLASAYADPGFIGEHRLGDLRHHEGLPGDIVFGTTEFGSGRSFRFQLSRRSTPFVGNVPPLAIDDEVVPDLRLADVVAASSCFPAAFEPMIFPDDFVWSRPLDEVRSRLSEELASGLPLMDGGIYDNQGVDGALAVYRRAGMEPGLLLVSDTSQRVRDTYTPPSAKQRGGPRLRTLRRWGKAFLAGSLLSTGLLVYKAVRDYGDGHLHWLDGILFGLPAVFCLGLALAIRAVDRRLGIEQERIRQASSIELWPNLQDLPALDLLDLLDARVRSLVSLTSDIFMKRVRGLIQTSLRVGERYRHRVVSNLIYDLGRERRRLYDEHPWMEPVEELRALSARAEAMPSKLWFEDQEELEAIVRCGRATTCFSILEFLLEKESEALTEPESPESRLLERARPVWERINRPSA